MRKPSKTIVVLVIVALLACAIAYPIITSYSRYRTLVERGETIIADNPPGTSEEALIKYLESNADELGGYSWKKLGEGEADKYSFYVVSFKGKKSLWSLIGQKKYLVIDIDKSNSKVASFHWGFQ